MVTVSVKDSRKILYFYKLHEFLSIANLIGQPCRHRWRTWSPPFGRAPTIGLHRLGERPAQARMGIVKYNSISYRRLLSY